MRNLCRLLGPLVLGATMLAMAALPGARPARADHVVLPAWMEDSFLITGRYLALWEYFRNGEETRFNIWVGERPLPREPRWSFELWGSFDDQGHFNVEWPWGPRIISGQRPTPRSGDSGDDRPFANVLTLRVEDQSSNTGWTDYLFPDDGASTLAPPVVTLPQRMGFFTRYRVPAAAPTASGINLEVNQRLELARDVAKIEVIITNNDTRARRVGARMLLDCFVDSWGPTRSVFLPKTRDRIFYEREFTGIDVPDEWEMYDVDEAPSAGIIAKGYLRGNGASTPQRVVFGNTLDMFPWALANNQYDWQVRPGWELRYSDIGLLIYWDPIIVPGNSTRSFVTYAGLGYASHGTSTFYRANRTERNLLAGFVGAIEAPFAVPVEQGSAHNTSIPVGVYMQNTSDVASPNSFAFVSLPEGLEFVDENQVPKLEFGNIARAGSGLDEGSGTVAVRPTGTAAGLLPIVSFFSNAYGDSAEVTRYINVPQGRRFQFSTDWRMVTMPFQYSNNQSDLSSVLGLPPGTFQVLRFNPAIRQYETVTDFRAGESYWVRLRGLPTSFVDCNGVRPVNLQAGDRYPVRLRPGWNQVGNPSPFAIPARELSVVTSTGITPISEAMGRGLIRSTIYEYSWKARRYVPLNREAILNPGQGIWIYSNAEQVILWPAPQGVDVEVRS